MSRPAIPALTGVLAGAVLLLGCGAGASWPPSPVEVRSGEDACAHCRMIVGDTRFAAQRHRRDGAVEIFDDLGCLLARRDDAPLDEECAFVRDVASGRWTHAESAFAVRSSAIASPMGSGYATFATRESAEAESRRLGGANVVSVAKILSARGADASLETRR